MPKDQSSLLPTSTSSSAYKRRSPPPSVAGRSSSPLPGPPSRPGSPAGMASSSLYASRQGATPRNAAPVNIYAATNGESSSILDSPAMMSMPLDLNDADGPFAYSTTLRRQQSMDHMPFSHFPHRPASPHHLASPYRKRTGSGGYQPYPLSNGQPPVPPPDLAGGGVGGMLRSVLRLGRRLAGRLDYDLLEQQEEDRRSADRRAQETPSAIYAHKSIDDTLSDFATDPKNGLSTPALASLLARYGPNEFELPPAEPLFFKFAKRVYEDPLILMLLASSVISAFLGSFDDAVCVVLAVLIVLTVGYVQEQRSEKSLEALNKLVPHYCHLVRNGQKQTPLANGLFPGDLVTFSVGDRIPADIRLISAVQLEVDESALTGETRPARKNTDICSRGEGEDTHGEGGGKALGERHCMVFMGTLVRSGHGSGIVVGTGKDTEFGVIFSMMQDVEEKKTPLQLLMDDLAKRLSMFSFAVIGVIVLVGVWQRRDWLEMFTIGVSLAVAAIPEGLPIVTTVTLALGVLRMSKRKAIIKKLPSVEALGSVSVICSDKTGTLTKNEMTVTHLYAVDDLLDLTPHIHHQHSFEPKHPDHQPLTPSPAMLKAVQIGTICNNAFMNEAGVNVGQATEVALLNVLSLVGQKDERKNFTRKSEIPFTSESKSMTVTGTLSGGSEMVYVKGAMEAVLAKCRYYYVTDSSTPSLDEATRKIIMNRAEETSGRGLRVLAMAYGFSKSSAPEANDLVFVGFEGMADPPRRGVAHAISALHTAGVQVVMITGDSEPTALAIARQLGLKVNASADHSLPGSSCLLGSQIDQLSERELIERVPSVTVFARTTPRHKMAIVKAWQMRGAVVAMTGDGVNDSPALKMADIGISMGKSGTDVAKEAADVILVDDDFSSILPAVEEGKSIFYNIQNFLSFQLSTAVAALTLITLSTFFRLANPLNAMQILFINILMDGPPAQALGVDPVDKEVMRRPPRKKGTPVLNRQLMIRVAFSATMIVCGTLFIYAHETSDGSMSRRDQTMTFTGFVFLDLVSALQNRGLTCPMFRNRMLFLTVSISFLCQLGLIYIPLLQHIFQTEALSLRDLFMLLGLAATSMGLHEGRRWWERKQGEREIFEQAIGGMA